VRILPWTLAPLVLALFASGILAARGLGIWKGRERALPPQELPAPAPDDASPGGLPM
jgi:hypothetical protein